MTYGIVPVTYFTKLKGGGPGALKRVRKRSQKLVDYAGLFHPSLQGISLASHG